MAWQTARLVAYAGIWFEMLVCYLKRKVKKLDARAREGIMMGYSKQSKGNKIWDIESKKCVVSRDVRFDETSGGDCTEY